MKTKDAQNPTTSTEDLRDWWYVIEASVRIPAERHIPRAKTTKGQRWPFAYDSKSIGRAAAAESNESSRIRALAASSRGLNPSV